MKRLQQLFRDAIPQQLTVLEAALSDLHAGKPGAAETLRRLAHRLVGSGGSYGYPQVSSAARSVESADAAELGPATTTLLDTLRGISAETPTRKKIVLAIDDDPLVTALLGATITGEDRTFVFAHSWEEGRKKLAEIQPDLILLDLMIGDADGRDVLVAIREAQTTANTPVIVLTAGIPGAAPRDECLALGASGFIEKPLNPKALRQAVHDQLRQSPVQVTDIQPGEVLDDAAFRALHTAPMSVLLAEDDEMVSSLVVSRLQRAGMTVDTFTNGMEALAAAKARRYSCAILDVKLPGIDGFAVLASLRGEPATVRMPVAMLTAMGQEKDIVRGLELGADDYIVKPFSPRELAARVQRLIGRAAQPAP